MKILVTGSDGQLASEINKISSNFNYNWIFLDRNNFDLSDLKKISINLNLLSPDIIINCASYNQVDNAEDNFESANKINHKAIDLIAKWCNINNCKLLHFSTDYVYHSKLNVALTEDTLPNPINNYGKTKLLGDMACIKNNPSSIIIRTSWLYSSFGNNFVKKIVYLMKKNNDLFVVNDQIGSPTYAGDLAEFIIFIIKNNKWIPGIYNYSNKGSISWYDLANDIKLIYGFNNININSISSNDYNTKAKRPNYSVLDNSKIKKTFQIKQINYKDSLRKCIEILKNDK